MINPAIEEDLKRMSLNDVNYADYIKENYIQIPDNATNGDVIKALFPNGYIKIGTATVTMNINGIALLAFPLKWWNSPYKADKESGE